MSDRESISDLLPNDGTRQIGELAIGRSGLRPIISLPEQQSQKVVKFIDILEYVAILLFVLSILLVFIGRLGIDSAFYVSLGVIALRAGTIIISMIIIAKPVNELESVDKVPEFVGDGGAVSFEDINLVVSVSDNEIILNFVNNHWRPVTVKAQLSSRYGRVEVSNESFGQKLETRFSEEKVVNPQQSTGTFKFELDMTENVVEKSTDIIDIDVSGSKINKDTEIHGATPIDGVELVVPVEITNADEIIEDSKQHMIVRK